MGVRVAGVILMLAACSAIGQSTATSASGSQTPALQDELKKLAADAALLHTDLPGFACTETAVSEAIKKNKRNPQKDKITERVQFVASVRAQRGEDGRLHESLTLSEVNGKPASGGRFDPPMMVEGGFDQSLDFFLAERQTCFNFTLERRPDRLRVSAGRLRSQAVRGDGRSPWVCTVRRGRQREPPGTPGAARVCASSPYR